MRAMGVDVWGKPAAPPCLPAPLLGPRERDWSSCWLVAGKLHDKCGSLTRWGFSVDPSPMGFDDRACDREAEAAAGPIASAAGGAIRGPEAAAAAIARAAVIEAVEAFEDLLELARRDARPAIADGDLESAVACSGNYGGSKR